MPLLGRKRWDVFLSHAHADAAEAKEIAAYLQERGLTLWFDQDMLRVGQLFDERIKQAIVDARALLVLMSQAATSSDYVKHEVSCALAHNIPIAPAFLEQVPKEMLKPPLSFSEVRVHAVKLIGEDRPARLARLAEDLQALRAVAQRRWWRRVAGLAAGLTLMLTLIGALWLRGERPMTLATIVSGDVSLQPPPDTAQPALAAATTALDFQVYGLHRGANAWTTLRNDDTLASGEHYCLRVQAPEAGFLYVFQQDSAGKIEWIFPQNKTSKYSHGSNPIAAGREIFLPAAEDRAYVLDDSLGTETFYAWFSTVPLPQLEYALERAALDGIGLPETRKPSEHAIGQPFLAAAKGMAGEATVGVERQTSRSVDGRAVPFAVKPVAFQGKGHWISVQWTIRHVAPAAK